MTDQPEKFELNDGFEDRIRRLQAAQYSILKDCMLAKKAGDADSEEAASKKLFYNNQELRSTMKAEALKFRAESRVDRAASDDQQVSQLLGAFVRGLRLTRLWRDVLMESRIAQRHGQKVVDIIQPALDALGRRGDLEAFLDHPDLSVRATAATWLIIRMPEKCVPILKEIASRDLVTTDAAGIAHWGLVIYENDPEFLARGDKNRP